MGHISANAGPHQLHWGDKEMKIACKYLVQENVVGLKPDKSDHLLQHGLQKLLRITFAWSL